MKYLLLLSFIIISKSPTSGGECFFYPNTTCPLQEDNILAIETDLLDVTLCEDLYECLLSLYVFHFISLDVEEHRTADILLTTTTEMNVSCLSPVLHERSARSVPGQMEYLLSDLPIIIYSKGLHPKLLALSSLNSFLNCISN